MSELHMIVFTKKIKQKTDISKSYSDKNKGLKGDVCMCVYRMWVMGCVWGV